MTFLNISYYYRELNIADTEKEGEKTDLKPFLNTLAWDA
jgi:hypothetical protein